MIEAAIVTKLGRKPHQRHHRRWCGPHRRDNLITTIEAVIATKQEVVRDNYMNKNIFKSNEIVK